MTSLEPPVLLEALSFIVDFRRDTSVLEFLRVRRILEPAATAMPAERVTADDIDGLRKLLDSLGPEPAVEDLVATDMEFHRRIAACSGNSVRCSLLETLSGPTTRARIWRGLTRRKPASGPSRSTGRSWTRSPRMILRRPGHGPPCTSPPWKRGWLPPCDRYSARVRTAGGRRP